MRLTSKIAALVLAGSAVLTPNTVLAYVFNDSGQVNISEEPKTWTQGGEWGQTPFKLDGTGGATLQSDGCSHFAITAAIAKTGKMPRGYDVFDMREDAAKVENEKPGALFRSLEDPKPNMAGMPGIEDLSKGELKYVSRIENSRENGQGMTIPELKKASWDKGYIAMITVPLSDGCCGTYSHYVLVDYFIDDNTFMMIDSGVEGNIYPNPDSPKYQGFKDVGEVYLFEMADGTDVRDLPHLDGTKGDIGAGTAGDGEDAGKDMETIRAENGGEFGLLDEEDLTGIQPFTQGEIEQREKLMESIPDLPRATNQTFQEVGYKQQYNIYAMQDIRAQEQEQLVSSRFSAGMAFVGLFLLMYSLAYIMAYAWDITFYTDGLAVGIVSLRRLGLRPDANSPKHDKNGRRLLTTAEYWFSLGCLIALGGLLISGTALEGVKTILQAIIGLGG